MRADIIMPTWDNLECTIRCIESIKKYTHYPYRLIWVDNGSDGEAVKAVEEKIISLGLDYIKVALDTNYGFTKAINEGIKTSDARYLILINNDIRVTDGWLAKLIEVSEQDARIAIVGPVTDRIGNRQQYERIAAGLGLEVKGAPENFFNSMKMRYIILNKNISFFCTLLKRELVEKIGLLDENLPMVGSDNDYNEEARYRGFKTAVCVNCFIYHEHHASLKKLKNLPAIREKTRAVLRRNRARRAG